MNGLLKSATDQVVGICRLSSLKKSGKAARIFLLEFDDHLIEQRRLRNGQGHVLGQFRQRLLHQRVVEDFGIRQAQPFAHPQEGKDLIRKEHSIFCVEFGDLVVRRRAQDENLWIGGRNPPTKLGRGHSGARSPRESARGTEESIIASRRVSPAWAWLA